MQKTQHVDKVGDVPVARSLHVPPVQAAERTVRIPSESKGFDDGLDQPVAGGEASSEMSQATKKKGDLESDVAKHRFKLESCEALFQTRTCRGRILSQIATLPLDLGALSKSTWCWALYCAVQRGTPRESDTAS